MPALPECLRSRELVEAAENLGYSVARSSQMA
jgi:hypothetical protein